MLRSLPWVSGVDATLSGLGATSTSIVFSLITSSHAWYGICFDMSMIKYEQWRSVAQQQEGAELFISASN